ncbi:hypothetical protein CDAR_501841 [Caerostris darwini]|uniref:Uncharacterized protein n=1 Tax=Caerostris darwini TaxID=1538125 RepID=A0AAV4TMJ9_9ARAC|nr:hypothetical protein CDAR_501841 [Caerostris darwini]
MLGNRTDLYIFQGGLDIGIHYCTKVILSQVGLFRDTVGPDFLFMDVNATTHSTVAVPELLKTKYIYRLFWAITYTDQNRIRAGPTRGMFDFK